MRKAVEKRNGCHGKVEEKNRKPDNEKMRKWTRGAKYTRTKLKMRRGKGKKKNKT